jgi:RNA polymerase sigma-70 factor, ECF subfamily
MDVAVMTGGDEGFEPFYRASYQPLGRALVAVVLDVHAAEEVAQEAFLRAYRDWPKVSSYEDPRGWLYRVAMRLAISRWRRLRTASAALIRYGAPAAVDAPDDLSLSVLAALRELPLQQRQALVMHHMLGIPVAQIAAEQGVAVGTVKARLSRGRAALAPLLVDLVEVADRG